MNKTELQMFAVTTDGERLEYLYVAFLQHVDNFHIDGIEIEPLWMEQTKGVIPAIASYVFSKKNGYILRNVCYPATFCCFKYDKKYAGISGLIFTGDIK